MSIYSCLATNRVLLVYNWCTISRADNTYLVTTWARGGIHLLVKAHSSDSLQVEIVALYIRVIYVSFNVFYLVDLNWHAEMSRLMGSPTFIPHPESTKSFYSRFSSNVKDYRVNQVASSQSRSKANTFKNNANTCPQKCGALCLSNCWNKYCKDHTKIKIFELGRYIDVSHTVAYSLLNDPLKSKTWPLFVRRMCEFTQGQVCELSSATTANISGVGYRYY